MRSQQNRRINNNRRNTGGGNGNARHSSNPLIRNYESSGPEVKIRGNARQIADKYLALARDSQAIGDRVMGENYLQHAEHYLRMILAAQSSERPDGKEHTMPRADAADASAAQNDAAGQNEQGDIGDMPQPVIAGVPGEVALMEKRGGYMNEAAAADGERSRQRRRLPARRSEKSNRFRRNTEGAGSSAAGEEALSADISQADSAVKESVKSAAVKNDAEEKIGRVKKVRRPRLSNNDDGRLDI